MKALEVHAPQFKEKLTIEDNLWKLYSQEKRFENRKKTLVNTRSKKWMLTKDFPYEMNYLDIFIFKNKLTGK